MNGKKLSVIGLALVCVLSLAGNLFLYQQNKGLTAQLTEQAAKTQELTQQTEDYHVQIASLQADLEVLQTSYDTAVAVAVAEAEKSTAGAASEAQAKTDYTQKQQQQKEPSQPSAPTKPTTPSSSSSTSTAPPASSKPSGGVTQDDVNDLLNEVLGGGGSSSKPSGGGSSGAPELVEGNNFVPSPGADGSGLGHGGTDTSNW